MSGTIWQSRLNQDLEISWKILINENQYIHDNSQD